MIGERLGAWRVVAPIGRGGMGTVWRAVDRAGSVAALKVIEGSPEALGVGLRRFAQELEVLRRLDHPRVVRPLSALERRGDRHWFAMQLVRGRSLAQLLEARGRLAPQDALSIAADALEGLEAAHAAGVLHRDVKSQNVLVDDQGRAVLVDFGLARAVDQTRLTLSGQALGTPAYASPEQARGQASRAESDLYSLGVVLYEALTGTLPFQAETPLALLRLHLDQEPDPPSTRTPDLPPALDGLLLRALAKDARARFPSAVAMREAVLAARAPLAGGDVAAPRAAAAVQELLRAADPEPAGPPSRRLLLVGLAPLLLLALLPLLAGPFRGAPSVALEPPAPVTSAPAAPATSAVDGSPAVEAGGVAVVRMRDGTTRRGQLVSIAQGRVRLRAAGGAEADLPLADVEKIGWDR